MKKRKGGKVTEYWYAWRGGPQILAVTARGDDELAREVSKAAAPAIEAWLRRKDEAPKSDTVTLYGLITRYLVALDDMVMADRTKRDLRYYCDLVRKDLGALELKALESPRARQKLAEWRDRYKKTPKVADARMAALRAVIEWAVGRGEVPTNPVAGLPALYQAPDRSHIIWEAHHLEILLHEAAEPFRRFVELAIHTGLRLGDLRSLPWSAVGEDAIIFQTGKSNKRRTVIVPITDELRVVLAGIPQQLDTSLMVLNSQRGRPWSEAGLETAINKHKAKALARVQKRFGPNATTGIEHLRIHDMRGTAATNFIRAGLFDEDVAQILGWKTDEIAEIRRRYVSGQEIGLAMVRRIKENKARAEIVNRPVNPDFRVVGDES